MRKINKKGQKGNIHLGFLEFFLAAEDESEVEPTAAVELVVAPFVSISMPSITLSSTDICNEVFFFLIRSQFVFLSKFLNQPNFLFGFGFDFFFIWRKAIGRLEKKQKNLFYFFKKKLSVVTQRKERKKVRKIMGKMGKKRHKGSGANANAMISVS